MSKFVLPACIASALFACVAHAALPDAWTDFELQARTNLLVNDEGWNLPPGSSFNSIDASLNDNAEVAFTVGVVPDGGSSHAGMWYGSHGVGGLVYESPNNEVLIGSRSPINAAGSIVFRLFAGPDEGLYVYDQTSGTAERISTSPVFPNSYGSEDINASGALGYQAGMSGGRLYAATDADGTLIYASDNGLDPESPYTYMYSSAFNDAAHIAAKVATSGDYSKEEVRLFAADGTSTLIVANQATDPESPYAEFDNSLDVNNNDVVAVVAERAADGRRVVLRSDGTTTTEIAAVDPAGTIRAIESFAPSINDAGWVVFRARDENGQAIYIGDGETLVRVIGKGDVVETDLGTAQIGQHIDDPDGWPIFSGKPAINALGDIAFVAGLHPKGDSQTEWGSGVFVAYAPEAKPTDIVFRDGFDG